VNAGAGGLIPLTEITASPDPQAHYTRLRSIYGDIAPVQLEPGVNAWLVLSWPAVREVVSHERIYSRDPHNWRDWQEQKVGPDSGLAPMMAPRDNAYFKDGGEHHRLRQPLDDGIMSLDQPQMRESVTAMASDLISGFAARGQADLVSEYAAVIPMLAVAALFGLDADRGHELQRAIMAMFGSGEDAAGANSSFETIIGECMRSHAQVPAADLTTAFQRHPNLHDSHEIAQSMVLMVSAGFETTTTWIAQALRIMLSDERFLGRSGSWRPGVDTALDEVLWRDPPMTHMPARYALADTELAGQRIREGDAIILGLSAAGNDPAIHGDDPWVEQENRSHLAWSTGPHACPAEIPARIITRAAVDTALSQLPGIKLAIPPEEIITLPSPWTRCPAALPVTFSPRPASGSTAAPSARGRLREGAAAGRI
jgi:cytochrome P450